MGSYYQYASLAQQNQPPVIGTIIGAVVVFGFIIAAALFMLFTFPKKFKHSLELNSQHWEGLAAIINAEIRDNPFPLTGNYKGYSVVAKLSPFGGRVNRYEIHLLTGSTKGQDWRIRFSNIVPGQAAWGIFALEQDFEQKVKSSGILREVAQTLERGEEISYKAKESDILYQFQISSFGILPDPAKFQCILDIMAKAASL